MFSLIETPDAVTHLQVLSRLPSSVVDLVLERTDLAGYFPHRVTKEDEPFDDYRGYMLVSSLPLYSICQSLSPSSCHLSSYSVTQVSHSVQQSRPLDPTVIPLKSLPLLPFTCHLSQSLKSSRHSSQLHKKSSHSVRQSVTRSINQSPRDMLRQSTSLCLSSVNEAGGDIFSQSLNSAFVASHPTVFTVTI